MTKLCVHGLSSCPSCISESERKQMRFQAACHAMGGLLSQDTWKTDKLVEEAFKIADSMLERGL